MARKQLGLAHTLEKCLVCGKTELKPNPNEKNYSVTCLNTECNAIIEISAWK